MTERIDHLVELYYLLDICKLDYYPLISVKRNANLFSQPLRVDTNTTPLVKTDATESHNRIMPMDYVG